MERMKPEDENGLRERKEKKETDLHRAEDFNRALLADDRRLDLTARDGREERRLDVGRLVDARRDAVEEQILDDDDNDDDDDEEEEEEGDDEDDD